MLCRVDAKQPRSRVKGRLRPYAAWRSAPLTRRRSDTLTHGCKRSNWALTTMEAALLAAKYWRIFTASNMARIGPKEIARYAKKGIFTVKQLSFLYRPRRRNRRGTTPPVKHLYELQALALRTGNIYLHGDAIKIPIASPEIYLDIEAVPEAEFHYLIGIVVTSREGVERFQYWADSKEEEATVFGELIALLHRFPMSPIFHYGSFERLALIKMGKVYGTSVDAIIARLFNVNTCVFGKIYFPARSNSLKDICKVLGLSWTSSCASGLQSIVWRYRYDETHDEAFRQLLLEYNFEDCENLRHLVERLRDIAVNGKHSADIRFADIEGGSVTENAARIVGRFGEILKSAHGTYEQAKIVLRKRKKTSTISSLEGKRSINRSLCKRSFSW